MDILELREYCLAKAHVTEGFPFGPDVLVFKVAGKMFALAGLNNEIPSVNLKCDPERAIELREHYEQIVPGYHMNKKLWNTVYFSSGLSDALVRDLIDHSYILIVESLPKKTRLELFP
ncbi:MAG: MmcQ/YjbR family DNA-binding protein [Flavobacteriales bacterium]|nr:MmcQ/YjbR family DNA-binding protein [Flavobacteriales bacterium]